MPRRRPIARLRLALTTLWVFGLAFAGWAELSARAWYADFEQWLIDQPMRVGVDLSKVGTTTTSFGQTCAVSHGEIIELLVGPFDAPADQVNLAGLVMSVSIADASGAAVSKVSIHGEDVPLGPSPIILTQFHPFREGAFTATIAVESPAPALAGEEQCLSARYELCGLEAMPSALAHWTAMLVGFASGIGVLSVLPGLVRFGIRRRA